MRRRCYWHIIAMLPRHAPELGVAADYLTRMQSAAGWMSTLIRDLFIFSSIETRQGISR